MVNLERFNLVCLKEIYILLKKYNYFRNIKTYQLCKYDLITLLRNTNLFDETEEEHLLFYNPKKKMWLKLYPKSKFYDRGDRIEKMRITKKPILIIFD